jgi:hypothetical protein
MIGYQGPKQDHSKTGLIYVDRLVHVREAAPWQLFPQERRRNPHRQGKSQFTDIRGSTRLAALLVRITSHNLIRIPA